jgi:hypothetical protein
MPAGKMRTFTASIALVTTLIWGHASHAIPADGPPPPPDCADDIAGAVTATPSSLDRETSASVPTTTLRWSVTVPKGCKVSLGLSLAGTSVAASGSKTFTATQSQTFALTANNLHRTLASVTVHVAGDPGFITVSPGRTLTADDLTKFNQQWMQPFELQQALGFAQYTLANRDPDGVWGTGERMAAMVRMYDLTFDTRYLDHLHDLAKLALQYRDDLPFDAPAVARPVEQIRNAIGVPAWGGATVESGGLHRVEEIVSSLYAYPIAAFARIVAENSALQAKYGAEAIDFANKVHQTVLFFLPQLRTAQVGATVESALTHPTAYANRPTAADCNSAHDAAMASDPGNASRWDQQRSDCLLLKEMAGRDLPHNINLTFAMVLMELSRVLQTNFYQQSPNRSVEAAAIGPDILLLSVIRQQRYFANHLNPGNLAAACPDVVCWNYMDNLLSDHDPHAEDLDHGAMDMSYVNVFLQNYGRVDLVSQQVSEPFVAPAWQAFARTFIKNTQDTNFRHDIAGQGEPAPYVANSRCEGWVSLAQADSRVYQTCHDVSLRIVGGAQPFLNIGNHSSLLANKKFGPQ